MMMNTYLNELQDRAEVEIMEKLSQPDGAVAFFQGLADELKNICGNLTMLSKQLENMNQPTTPLPDKLFYISAQIDQVLAKTMALKKIAQAQGIRFEIQNSTCNNFAEDFAPSLGQTLKKDTLLH